MNHVFSLRITAQETMEPPRWLKINPQVPRSPPAPPVSLHEDAAPRLQGKPLPRLALTSHAKVRRGAAGVGLTCSGHSPLAPRVCGTHLGCRWAFGSPPPAFWQVFVLRAGHDAHSHAQVQIQGLLRACRRGTAGEVLVTSDPVTAGDR